MVQCTTYGYGGKPGLPKKELDELKETVRSLYPKYWNAPHDFELAWNKCTESMSQACNRLRAKQKQLLN